MLSHLKCLALTAALGLALGCGSSSTSGSTAAMNVHVTDGPISGYQEINVHIQSVEIKGDGGWITLGTPDVTLNLLTLTGGVSQTLAAGATLPAGHYGQMRLILGAGNTVKLADGSVHDLTVPSGLQTGLKLTVSFDVAAGTTKDVWIDFDAAHSIQVVATGASSKFMLRPTLRACDKVATGAISGTFTDAASSAPLAGAMVFAETLDGTGAPHLVRSTVTDAAGHYLLDLLPVGASYHVVSLPRVGAPAVTAYGAQASDALAVTAGTPVLTFNATFTAAVAVGGVGGDVTPVATADQHDTVDLQQALMADGASHTFIVDTVMATVGTSTETYAFANLPVGTYAVQGRRSTLNADGSVTVTTPAPLPAAVTAGLTLSLAVTF
ncbi:MAG TPA: DUF4382 domain-containing protein [Holophagaceae bacterium]|nr:DUF4382 domain-containing protein [Holophagaceae bacterium]